MQKVRDRRRHAFARASLCWVSAPIHFSKSSLLRVLFLVSPPSHPTRVRSELAQIQLDRTLASPRQTPLLLTRQNLSHVPSLLDRRLCVTSTDYTRYRTNSQDKDLTYSTVVPATRCLSTLQLPSRRRLSSFSPPQHPLSLTVNTLEEAQSTDSSSRSVCSMSVTSMASSTKSQCTVLLGSSFVRGHCSFLPLFADTSTSHSLDLASS